MPLVRSEQFEGELKMSRCITVRRVSVSSTSRLSFSRLVSVSSASSGRPTGVTYTIYVYGMVFV